MYFFENISTSGNIYFQILFSTFFPDCINPVRKQRLLNSSLPNPTEGERSHQNKRTVRLYINPPYRYRFVTVNHVVYVKVVTCHFWPPTDSNRPTVCDWTVCRRAPSWWTVERSADRYFPPVDRDQMYTVFWQHVYMGEFVFGRRWDRLSRCNVQTMVRQWKCWADQQESISDLTHTHISQA